MAEKRSDVGIDPANKTAQREMWDSWWYDRFEIPHAIPSGARRLELEMGGETFGAVLLDHVASKTCQAFWDILPYAGNMIHCAWFGHAAFYLDRVPLLATLGYALENRFQRPGTRGHRLGSLHRGGDDRLWAQCLRQLPDDHLWQ
jgi:hypothetical protein